MRTTEHQSTTKLMPIVVRPLESRDVPQCAEVERDAFPTLTPKTSFRRELRNRLASYLVAFERQGPPRNDQSTSFVNADSVDPGAFKRLFDNARNIWPGQFGDHPAREEVIVGFLGTWHMADEAHIVSVAVRSQHRGHGIGELLLIAAIEEAMTRRSRVVTLEVRPSNAVAWKLYAKYGFTERGVRKAYYADNREDALIMTTDPIHVSPFPRHFGELVAAHRQS